MPLLDGYHGNLAKFVNGENGGSFKNDPSSLDPTSYSNDESGYHIPSILGSYQVVVVSYQDLVYRPLLDGFRGNLANRGDGDSSVSSKLNPSSLSPSYYYN